MKSLEGHLLVARPELTDLNFRHTVLLMLDHSDEGAAGLVLNRPTRATLVQLVEQVLEQSTDWDKQIHLGGPVPGPLLVLHAMEAYSDRRILDGLYSTVEPDQIRAILEERLEPSLFLANYSGWGPGQLESEIEADSWLFTPATAESVFAAAEPTSWEPTIRGIRSRHMARVLRLDGIPGDPSQN